MYAEDYYLIGVIENIWDYHMSPKPPSTVRHKVNDKNKEKVY